MQKTWVAWGYTTNKKKLATRATKKQPTEQRHDILMRSGDVDPVQSSAARALDAMNLDIDTDFDDGIRASKKGFSEATEADAITERIQSPTLKYHTDSQRKRMNNLPT